jgi:DDE superfamily endonuclease
VSDVRGRILDISIVYPGSTSNCLAFEGTMSLFQKLEHGILAPGLCLFGNNAYLNAPYMATPYPAVLGRTNDAYNFYLLHLHIQIEFTFGMFIHRWAILRSAIPLNVSVQKTVALILALAKLHNCCINAHDSSVPPSTASDAWENEVHGAVPLVQTQHSSSMDEGITSQQELLDGGNHFDNVGRTHGCTIRQRRYNYMVRTQDITLPRDVLQSW